METYKLSPLCDIGPGIKIKCKPEDLKVILAKQTVDFRYIQGQI